MGKRKRQLLVAIVDDDSGMRAAIENLLNSTGLRTPGFASAEEFLRSAQGGKAGCLILDLRLPGMSGLELERELQAKGVAIPVIFVTAEADVTQLSGTGAVAGLRKPFDPDELSRLVTAAHESHRGP